MLAGARQKLSALGPFLTTFVEEACGQKMRWRERRECGCAHPESVAPTCQTVSRSVVPSCTTRRSCTALTALLGVRVCCLVLLLCWCGLRRPEVSAGGLLNSFYLAGCRVLAMYIYVHSPSFSRLAASFAASLCLIPHTPGPDVYHSQA